MTPPTPTPDRRPTRRTSGGMPDPRDISGGMPTSCSGGMPDPRKSSGGMPTSCSGGMPTSRANDPSRTTTLTEEGALTQNFGMTADDPEGAAEEDSEKSKRIPKIETTRTGGRKDPDSPEKSSLR